MRNKFIMAILGGLLLATLAIAQAAPTPAPQGQKRQWTKGQGMQQMAQRLNLTADQQAKLKSLRESQRQQMQAIKQDTTLTQEQKREKFQQLRAANHEQMLGILTPEQQAQMKQMRAGKMRRMAYGRGFQAGRMAGALNLTDAQKQQMKPIFQATRQQVQAVRQDTTLTPQQKREKVKEIRQNQMAQVKSILTPEQQQKMEQLRNNRRHRGFKQQSAPNGI